MHHDIYFVHASYSFCSIFFCANLQSALGFVFFFFFFSSLLCFGPYSSTMPSKTRANRIPFTPSVSPSRSQLFKNDCCHEAFEKMNSKRKIWAEHSVILDEVDLAIRANLMSRGWLSLLEIDHPPSTALIRKFFSNLSCHIYDSNTLVKSWIRGVEFTITPRVVAEALGVPIVTEHVYPYAEAPPLDVVMSYITGSSIQWSSDPRITSSALFETAYLFLRVACHSLWPISHLHTIPLERCVFLCAFISGASISFPHLFLRSLNEVHRSSAIGHALIHPIFIHRILLFLSLVDFPSGEPVHVVASLGATFLKQRTAHLRVDPSGPRGTPSGDVPPLPSSTVADADETSSAAVADANNPPPTTLNDSNIQRTLDHVLTVQATQGQILVDVLNEICGLQADLARFQCFSPPPPYDDGF